MRRRALLQAASGLAAALGGCSSLGGRSPTDPESDDPDTAERSPTDSQPTTESTTTERPPADDALVVVETYPVEGTMVRLGAGGTVRNDADRALVDCVVQASGTVGDTRYSATASRDRLDPGATWEWEVTFAEEATESNDDAVGDLVVEASAAYAA